jgi:hypothetical protein
MPEFQHHALIEVEPGVGDLVDQQAADSCVDQRHRAGRFAKPDQPHIGRAEGTAAVIDDGGFGGSDSVGGAHG